MQKYRNHIFYTNASGEIWTGEGIKPQEFNQKWDSLLEFAVHKHLLKITSSSLWTVHRQVPITLNLPAQFKPIKWVFDFCLRHPTENVQFLEVKGGYLKQSRTEGRALAYKLLLFHIFNKEVFNRVFILSDHAFKIPNTQLTTINYKEFTI